MGTVVGTQIIQRAMRTLNDAGNVRWALAELLDWLNDAQREIAILRPDSSTLVAPVPLTPGRTLQALPTGTINATRLIDITRNLGTDGQTPGAPIRLVAREELDQYRPSWHTDTASMTIKNYVYDGRSPRAFYVYPQPAVSLSVEMHMAVVPTDVTMQDVNGGAIDSQISVDDVYQTAIYDFVVFRALSKNTDAKNDQEAVRSYQAFLNRLGLKLQADRAFDPHRNAPPQEPKRAANADTAL
jgi:hypothetical protein